MRDLKGEIHVAGGEASTLQEQLLTDTGRAGCGRLGWTHRETGGPQGLRKGKKNNYLKPPPLRCCKDSEKPTQNMLLWPVDYFELKAVKTQKSQEKGSASPLIT